MQNENELVNQVAKDIFVGILSSQPGLYEPEKAKKAARMIYELARAFAEVAKEQPANKVRFQMLS